MTLHRLEPTTEELAKDILNAMNAHDYCYWLPTDGMLDDFLCAVEAVYNEYDEEQIRQLITVITEDRSEDAVSTGSPVNMLLLQIHHGSDLADAIMDIRAGKFF